MAFLRMSDETDEIECVVFPDVFKKYSPLCQKGLIVVVEGNVENRNGKKQVIARALEDASPFRSMPTGATLYLKIPAGKDRMLLVQVKQVLDAFPGDSPVILHYEEERKTIRLPEKNRVRAEEACLEKLTELLGEGNVILK